MVNRRGSTEARKQSYGASETRRRERAERHRDADARRARRNLELRASGMPTAWEVARAVRRERRLPLQALRVKKATGAGA